MLQCTISESAQSFKDFCALQHKTDSRRLDGRAPAQAIWAMDQPHNSSLDRRRRGLLIVLSSPSGAGKSTISRMLLKADPEVTMSISATTRPMRPGERDDVDYHFVADAEFDRLIAAGEFVEWAPVFDYRYGTPKAPVKAALKAGQRHLVRHRLAGHAAASFGDGRGPRPHLHPAAVAGRARAPPAPPRHRQRRGHRQPHAARGERDQPLGRI